MSLFNKQQLQQQVAAGESGEVIQYLVNHITFIEKESLQQEVFHLSARWKDLQRKTRMGTVAQSELDLAERQINYSLLALLEEIDFHFASSNQQTSVEALQIHCTTNKGKENLQFKAGESILVYYEVNRPCFLRVLYRLADGRVIVLHEDLELKAEVVGKRQLLDEFEVSEPFGQEELRFFAQNIPFPSIHTQQTEDGYVLLVEDTPEALMKTRGLKKKRYFAEATLNIQTLE